MIAVGAVPVTFPAELVPSPQLIVAVTALGAQPGAATVPRASDPSVRMAETYLRSWAHLRATSRTCQTPGRRRGSLGVRWIAVAGHGSKPPVRCEKMSVFVMLCATCRTWAPRRIAAWRRERGLSHTVSFRQAVSFREIQGPPGRPPVRPAACPGKSIYARARRAGRHDHVDHALVSRLVLNGALTSGS